MDAFLNLPNEIIEIIVGYLPNEDVIKLIEIPKLRKYAERALYSVIIIDDGEQQKTPFPSLHNYTTRLNSPQAFLGLVKSKPHVSPRKLMFENPFDALVIARECPQYLANVNIELAFWTDQPNFPSYKIFGSEFKKTPFPADSILTRFGTGFEEYLSLELMRNVSSLFLVPHAPVELESISTTCFPNLTSLSIREYLTPDQLKLLPKQLKKLICDIEPNEEVEQEEILKLDLPETLVKLQVTVGEGSREDVYDISHLTELSDLKVSSQSWNSYAPTKSRILWKLPSSLRTLEIDWSDMIIGELFSECPKIINLRIGNIDFLTRGVINPKCMQLLDIAKHIVLSTR